MKKNWTSIWARFVWVLIFSFMSTSVGATVPDFTAMEDIGDSFYLLDDIYDPQSTVVVAKIDAAQLSRLISVSTYGDELESITKKLYRKFKDDFDFIVFVLDKEYGELVDSNIEFSGVHHRLRNDVKGIGMPMYDIADELGSKTKLKSLIYIPFSWSPYGDRVVSGLSIHELAHTWAADIVPTFNWNNIAENSHWGISNAGGKLGGFKYVKTLEENSDGVLGKTKYQGSISSDFSVGFFNAGSYDNQPYSDIELYLMGMKSAQELRDANFVLDVYTGISDGDPYTSVFCSTGVISYTIDDIIAKHGPRIPDAASSQKSFKIMTVILSDGNGDEHFSTVIDDLKWLAGPESDNSAPQYNFAQATLGRGTLEIAGVRESYPNPDPYLPDDTGGSDGSSGCNAGFGVFGLAAAVLLLLKKK